MLHWYGSEQNERIMIMSIQSLDSLEQDLYSKNPDDIFEDYFKYLSNLNMPSCRVNTGKVYFRARKGYLNLPGAIDDLDTYISYPFYNRELNAPPPIMSAGGRFNREGTSFLYLASTVKTCIAEIHLEVNQICSVGRFKCIRRGKYLHVPSSQDITGLYKILTQPIYSEIKHKYLITQFLSDIFKKMGFRGIIFDSTQSSGTNIVCYYPSDYEFVEYSEKMYTATKIIYRIKEVHESYKQYTDYRRLLGPGNISHDEDEEQYFDHINKRIIHDDETMFNLIKQKIAAISTPDEKLEELTKLINDFCGTFKRKDAYCLRGDYYLNLGNQENAVQDYIEAFSNLLANNVIDQVFNYIKISGLLSNKSDSDVEKMIQSIYKKKRQQDTVKQADLISKLGQILNRE